MEETDKSNKETGTVGDGSRIDRIADQTRGLIEDVKEWIDLRVQLIQLEVEDRFETVANQLLSTMLVIVLAFTTLIFALIAASLGIGKLLGDPLWGFLATTLVLAAATIVVRLFKPRIVKAPWANRSGMESEKDVLPEHGAQARLPEVATPSNDHESSEVSDGRGA
jgi:hypothetical protein